MQRCGVDEVQIQQIEELKHLCWTSVGCGEVHYEIVLSQRDDLLRFLVRSYVRADCMSLRTALETRVMSEVGAYMSPEQLECAVCYLLALRLAAEAALSGGESLAVESLLNSVFRVELLTWPSPPADFQLRKVKLLLELPQAEAWVLKSQNKLTKNMQQQLRELKVSEVLVVNANACSRLMNEPFDVVSFFRTTRGLMGLLVDCAAVRSADGAAPTYKLDEVGKKAAAVRDLLNKSGFANTKICAVVATTSSKATSRVASETPDLCVVMLGPDELRALMPPWSEWVLRAPGMRT